MKKYDKDDYRLDDYKLVVEWVENKLAQDYSAKEYETAWWHLWQLNCYHITMSFDANITILLDWAISYHMGRSD